MNWLKKRLYYRRRKRISDLIYSKDLVKDIGMPGDYSYLFMATYDCEKLAEEILDKLGIHKPTKQKI